MTDENLSEADKVLVGLKMEALNQSDTAKKALVDVMERITREMDLEERMIAQTVIDAIFAGCVQASLATVLTHLGQAQEEAAKREEEFMEKIRLQAGKTDE